MTSMLLKELEDIFDGSDNPFLDPEKEGRLAKIAIKCDLDKGLPNDKYYVGKTEVTIDNIDNFSYQQLSKSFSDHLDKIMTDPNSVLIL